MMDLFKSLPQGATYFVVALCAILCGVLFLLSAQSLAFALVSAASLCAICILVALIKSKTAFLWLIFIYPLLPVHMGYDLAPGVLPVFKIHRILTAILLLFWIVKSKTKMQSIRTFPLSKVFMLLFVPMLIVSLLSKSKVYSLFYVGSFTIEYFLFGVMFFDLVRDDGLRNRIFFLISLSAFLAAITGIAEYYTGVNFYSFVEPFNKAMAYAVNEQTREASLRIKGAFEHSISFGVYLSLSLMAVLYLYSTHKNILKKISYALMLLVMGYAIFLTRSRIAINLFLIILSTTLFFKKRIELLVLAVIAIIVLLQPTPFDSIKEDFIYMVKSSVAPLKFGTQEMAGSLDTRFSQVRELTKLIARSPVTGYGKYDLVLGSIDNFYLLFTVYFGLPSLLGFFIVNLKFLSISVFLFIKGSVERIRLLGLIMAGGTVGFILILAAVSLESYFYLLWVYMGLTSRCYIEEKAGSH